MMSLRTCIAGVLVAVSTTAIACNIPVFRYALERWKSDAYEIVVVHGDELTDEQLRFVDSIEKAAGSTNVSLTRSRNAAVKTPQVAVRLEMASGRVLSNWQGTIDEAANANLLDSPVRKQLVKRLLAGDSIVWLLLRSKDTARSDAARQLLDQSLQALSSRVRLPDGIGQPGSELHSEVPLFVQFSVVEVDSDDNQESFLIRWLSGFRPEAVEKNEPLVVPVFGRGRALEVVPQSELNADLVEDLTLFLSGACSCQVKEQNPGFDLLLTAEWDNQLFGVNGLRPPPAKTAADGGGPPRTLAIPPGKKK